MIGGNWEQHARSIYRLLQCLTIYLPGAIRLNGCKGFVRNAITVGDVERLESAQLSHHSGHTVISDVLALTNIQLFQTWQHSGKRQQRRVRYA